MKLARRSFFKFSAGAAMAGPKAIEAVAKDIDQRAMGYVDLDVYGPPPPPVEATKIAGELKRYRDRLLKITDQPRTPRPDRVTRLDADLVANRSMSLDARIRIQAERDAVRIVENERSFLERQIDRLLRGEL